MTVVVIEDEEPISELVSYNLKKEGWDVSVAMDGDEGLQTVRDKKPDLVVLDLMLPGMSGLDVCKALKADSNTSDIPVVMLTAKGEEADIVTGLELGADDYITKPFSPRVVIARLRAVMRRSRSAPIESDDNQQIKIHDLVVHPGRHEVTVADKPVQLTITEFRVLQFLARRPGWVFTRYQIVDAVHGDDYPVTDRSVDVQIVGLRRKLGNAGNYIETVRGVGYRFKESL